MKIVKGKVKYKIRENGKLIRAVNFDRNALPGYMLCFQSGWRLISVDKGEPRRQRTISGCNVRSHPAARKR